MLGGIKLNKHSLDIEESDSPDGCPIPLCPYIPYKYSEIQNILWVYMEIVKCMRLYKNDRSVLKKSILNWI